jgi:hypothetical protein
MNVPSRSAAAAALLLMSAAACPAASAPGAAGAGCPDPSGEVLRPQGEGWHHGPIVEIDSTSPELGNAREWSRRLLVQVQPAGAWSGRIWFTVNESTRLLCRSGAAAPRSVPLTPGTTVSAMSRMIQESDPGQAFADTLIVGPVP